MSSFPETDYISLTPVELKYLSEYTVQKILRKMLGDYFYEKLIAKSGAWEGKLIGKAWYYIEKDKRKNVTKVWAIVSAGPTYNPVKELSYCKGRLYEIDKKLEWFYDYRRREGLDSESREWVERMIKLWEEKKEKAINWYLQLDNYISELNYLLNRTKHRLEKLKEIDDEIGRGSFRTLIEYVGEDYVRERLKEIFLKE
jgi:hypothetical protein